MMILENKLLNLKRVQGGALASFFGKNAQKVKKIHSYQVLEF
ncbi:hypothetical protein X924_02880 [Petrotoga sp. 9PWA.NaAc.5.4]|nr:hypothetical protein X924_02880 [Petrotoga sp. 9PWA.NaAc.5.4]